MEIPSSGSGKAAQLGHPVDLRHKIEIPAPQLAAGTREASTSRTSRDAASTSRLTGSGRELAYFRHPAFEVFPSRRGEATRAMKPSEQTTMVSLVVGEKKQATAVGKPSLSLWTG
jgi:hypothetical protein